MFGISVSCGCCWVAQSCLTLCDPIDCSTPALFVLRHLSKFAQVHVHCIGDAIQPSHPLTPPSSSALYLSQHQGLFQWVSCLHQMIRILEFQLQHQSFQWVLRADFPCLTGLISLLSKGLLGVFSSTTIQGINSSALHLLYGPILTTLHDPWEDPSFYCTDQCQ